MRLMAPQELTVVCISRIRAGQLAIQLAPPVHPDIGFVYRAGISIYWEPNTLQLVDRYDREDSVGASFHRIRFAIEDELGMRLCRAADMRWQDIDGAELTSVEDEWRKALAPPACIRIRPEDGGLGFGEIAINRP